MSTTSSSCRRTTPRYPSAPRASLPFLCASRADSHCISDLVPPWYPTQVAPKPIEITQPQGPSFTIDAGNKLTWQGWDLTVGFNAREGLTLHDLAFTEPGTPSGARRPICYRASVAEMVVPYGSPSRGLWRKSVFDTGEAGLGKCVNALQLGCDCLGPIHYLDVALPNEKGGVDMKPNAICIHEEDDGVLWKHQVRAGVLL